MTLRVFRLGARNLEGKQCEFHGFFYYLWNTKPAVTKLKRRVSSHQTISWLLAASSIQVPGWRTSVQSSSNATRRSRIQLTKVWNLASCIGTQEKRDTSQLRGWNLSLSFCGNRPSKNRNCSMYACLSNQLLMIVNQGKNQKHTARGKWMWDLTKEFSTKKTNAICNMECSKEWFKNRGMAKTKYLLEMLNMESIERHWICSTQN